ncbi:hypothetical protein MATL_G00037970 [Megalops atlanticus]|uniref:Uncharacterized protein n=1 Tax=Megalops atlanticus TaxID=7932 RepID=A0A9D3TGS1_MEGAT|nr:hypothetical protein MATL_G00037970 [Megalops atlanticus]
MTKFVLLLCLLGFSLALSESAPTSITPRRSNLNQYHKTHPFLALLGARQQGAEMLQELNLQEVEEKHVNKNNDLWEDYYSGSGSGDHP